MPVLTSADLTSRAPHAGPALRPTDRRPARLAHQSTERSRRVWAATEARAIGYGGIALVERATGISRATIQRGIRELDADTPLPPGRTRKAGAGRMRTTALDRTLLADLDALVEPTARGIRSRRCGGPARACARWRWRWAPRASYARPISGTTAPAHATRSYRRRRRVCAMSTPARKSARSVLRISTGPRGRYPN
jgi:hypothetical protein